jgi:tripartite-type tricarboxylate transporter receptor subunit TctC
MRSIIKGWIGIVILAIAIDNASAQSDTAQYPNQIVRIVVPVSPGSIADNFARLIAERLTDTWKQQVIVENRPSLAGVTSVAKSAPDGYTLLLHSNGHTVAGAINKNLPFDPVKDFAGVALIATAPLVMIVPPTSPARSVNAFVALAKDKPGQLNVANAGVSTTSFLSAEVFRQSAKIAVVHVPYRGGPEAVTAVVRGDAHMYFAPVPSAQELHAVGKVVVLAVNSPARIPQMPDVPTVAEVGPADFRYESWFGLLAPAATPRPIVEKISREVAKAIPELRDRIEKQGALPVSVTPEQFDAIIRNDTERNGKLLRDAGIIAN